MCWSWRRKNKNKRWSKTNKDFWLTACQVYRIERRFQLDDIVQARSDCRRKKKNRSNYAINQRSITSWSFDQATQKNMKCFLKFDLKSLQINYNSSALDLHRCASNPNILTHWHAHGFRIDKMPNCNSTFQSSANVNLLNLTQQSHNFIGHKQKIINDGAISFMRHHIWHVLSIKFGSHFVVSRQQPYNEFLWRSSGTKKRIETKRNWKFSSCQAN